MVKEYLGTKYLTMAKENSSIVPIADIGAVAKGEDDKDDELRVINDVTALGVPYLDVYISCLLFCGPMFPNRLQDDTTVWSCWCFSTTTTSSRKQLAHLHTVKLRKVAGGDDVTITVAGQFKSMTLLKNKDIIRREERLSSIHV